MEGSPKEKVRANIYKTLLEEEKKKKKNYSILSVSLFAVGVFAGNSLDTIKSGLTHPEPIISIVKPKVEKDSTKQLEFDIDNLFKEKDIKLDEKNYDYENLFVTDVQI